MTSNALLLDDGIIKMNHFTIRMMRVLSLWIWWIIPTISFSFQPAQSKTRSRRYHCLESTITDDDTIQQIQQSQLQLQSQSQSTTDTTTNIVFPNSSFRKTLDHEVSVASFNMLAPFYNSLALLDWEAREPFAEQDRTNRVPLAIQMAKQTNADVLCLQEVEGLQHESRLKQLLMEPHKDMDGYDSLLWAPLMPKREGDIVGLCVAWRSKKHTVRACRPCV